jgi:hypothetical protein
MKTDNNNYEIPFQIENLIATLDNKQENEHTRNNYRMRLDSIRRAIDAAIIRFDIEMGTMVTPKYKKGVK